MRIRRKHLKTAVGIAADAPNRRRITMKNLLVGPAVALAIVLAMAGLALAGSTASVTVSCSIPVMPGLNAPLIEEEGIKTQENINAKQKIAAQKETPQESIALPQQDIDKEEKIVEGGNSAMAVKTYYSR